MLKYQRIITVKIKTLLWIPSSVVGQVYEKYKIIVGGAFLKI